jgi:hypothetical protein
LLSTRQYQRATVSIPLALAYNSPVFEPVGVNHNLRDPHTSLMSWPPGAQLRCATVIVLLTLMTTCAAQAANGTASNTTLPTTGTATAPVTTTAVPLTTTTLVQTTTSAIGPTATFPSTTVNANATATSVASTTSTAVTTHPPTGGDGDGGASPPVEPIAGIKWALLGAAFGLALCGGCAFAAYWVHRRRRLPGLDVVAPSHAQLAADLAEQAKNDRQRRDEEALKYGTTGLRVRGQTLVKLKSYWDAKREDEKRRAAKDASPAPEATVTHNNGAASTAAAAKSKTKKRRAEDADSDGDDRASLLTATVNPIDRLAGDGVASYRTEAGRFVGDLPWEGVPGIAADGVPVIVISRGGRDAATAPASPAPSEFTRLGRAPPPPSMLASKETPPPPPLKDEPFIVDLPPAGTPPAVSPSSGNFFVRVREFFRSDAEIDEAHDARIPRPTGSEVFDSLAKRDAALTAKAPSARHRRPSRGNDATAAAQAQRRLELDISQHEMAEEALLEMNQSEDLCRAWLTDVEPPKVDPEVAARNVQAWCRDLPPEPVPAAAFAAQRTQRWVTQHKPGAYALPGQRAATPPAQLLGLPHAAGHTTPQARTPPTGTSRAQSGLADATHLPVAVRLTADTLKLPPRRDALGRLPGEGL